MQVSSGSDTVVPFTTASHVVLALGASAAL